MKGLTSAQAKELLTKYGENIIPSTSKSTFLRKFVAQFNNFLTYLLSGAALISFMIGETVDGFLIFAIVILNGLFGLYQEQKAEEALEKLSEMTVATVRVIRNDREVQIDSRELVPGDMVFIEEGAKIAADGLIETAVNLEVNESSLTGESYPVVKAVGDEIYGGTVVSRGRGFFTVSKTGTHTKFGKIAEKLAEVTREQTPLQRKLAGLTKAISYVGVFLAVLIFILSSFISHGYGSSFLLAVSFAVAVVPEGLPAVTTIILAIGVGEMARKKSIIRRLSAIETLGSVTLIATDKTGTLTQNNMVVKEVFVDGVKARDLLLLNGILCSTASLVPIHGSNKFDVLGDPTEGALLHLGLDNGFVPEEVRETWKVVDEKPFDSITKMMTVVVKALNNESRSMNNGKSHNSEFILHNSKQIVFSKGAPESILNVCSKTFSGESVVALTPKKKETIEKEIDMWARQGLRILAFAYKPHLAKPSRGKKEKNMIFLGLVAMHDSPRPEVKEAVQMAFQAGIKVVMITGDNEKTAEAVGVATGVLQKGDEIMTGAQIEEYTDEELMVHLPRVKAFARITPLDKHRIVRLYQKLGEVVAVTGDGVNDAIALKQADVGVAMGLIGTDVARETADMVVTDDNFASIVAAVSEGRHVVRSLTNSIKYLIAGNSSEALALIAALVLGIPHLFVPVQILYINLISDGFPALALAFSPRRKERMNEPPRNSTELLISFDIYYILCISILISAIVIMSYFFFGQGEAGRTAAFSILVVVQSFLFIDLWLSHKFIGKIFTYGRSLIFFAAFLVPFLLQYAIVRIPVIAGIFKIQTVSSGTYLQFVAFSSVIVIGIELIKKLLRYSHDLK